MSAFKKETVTCSAARQSVNGVSETCFGKNEVGLLQLQRLSRLGQLCVTGYMHCNRVFAAGYMQQHALERVCCSRESVSRKISSVLWGRLGQGVKEDCTEAR